MDCKLRREWQEVTKKQDASKDVKHYRDICPVKKWKRLPTDNKKVTRKKKKINARQAIFLNNLRCYE